LDLLVCGEGVGGCQVDMLENLLKKSSIGGNKYTKDYESNDAALGYF
jgi:hypothetical protein